MSRGGFVSDFLSGYGLRMGDPHDSFYLVGNCWKNASVGSSVQLILRHSHLTSYFFISLFWWCQGTLILWSWSDCMFILNNLSSVKLSLSQSLKIWGCLFNLSNQEKPALSNLTKTNQPTRWVFKPTMQIIYLWLLHSTVFKLIPSAASSSNMSALNPSTRPVSTASEKRRKRRPSRHKRQTGQWWIFVNPPSTAYSKTHGLRLPPGNGWGGNQTGFKIGISIPLEVFLRWTKAFFKWYPFPVSVSKFWHLSVTYFAQSLIIWWWCVGT